MLRIKSDIILRGEDFDKGYSPIDNFQTATGAFCSIICRASWAGKTVDLVETKGAAGVEYIVEGHGYRTVFSCLDTALAVFQADRITRVNRKFSGFECAQPLKPIVR